MIVFRLGRTKYIKDLTGEGARLNGGRWNHKGVACVYTAESRALALLEYTVNVNIDDIPRSLSIATLEIPDTFLEFKEHELPGDWKNIPSPASTKDFGSSVLSSAKYPVIKLPSSVIKQEFNYILNPTHLDSKSVQILDVVDFVYDVRIKLV